VKDRRNVMTTYRYDDAGRLTSVVDSTGARRTYEYDKAGRYKATVDPVHNQRAAAGQPLVKELELGYTRAGRLETVADARRRTTTYHYDDVGRRDKITDALNQTIVFKYDPAGNLTDRYDQI